MASISHIVNEKSCVECEPIDLDTVGCKCALVVVYLAKRFRPTLQGARAHVCMTVVPFGQVLGRISHALAIDSRVQIKALIS